MVIACIDQKKKNKKPLEHQIYIYRMFQYQSFELNCSAKFQRGSASAFVALVVQTGRPSVSCPKVILAREGILCDFCGF